MRAKRVALVCWVCLVSLVMFTSFTDAAENSDDFFNYQPSFLSLEPAAFSGEWAGTTDQGHPVTFTVLGNLITYFQIKMDLGDQSCKTSYQATFENPDVPIESDQYEIPVHTTPSTSGELLGAFTGDTTSTGSWNYTFTGTCTATGSGTWQAGLVTPLLEPRPGVWKSTDDGFLSIYIQKYTTGSCVLVFTVGDGSYVAFIDPDYTDGISVENDLYGGGYSVSMTFTNDSNGSVTVELPGFGSITRDVSLVFEEWFGDMAPANGESVWVPGSGIYKSDDNTVSVFFQRVDTGACIMILTRGDGSYIVFLFPDCWNTGAVANTDFDGKGYDVQWIRESPTEALMRIKYEVMVDETQKNVLDVRYMDNPYITDVNMLREFFATH